MDGISLHPTVKVDVGHDLERIMVVVLQQRITRISKQSGRGLMYVFSTNADPFENDHCYDKFAAYTFLNQQRRLESVCP